MRKLRNYLVVLTILATASAPVLAQSFGIKVFGSSAAFAAVTNGPAADDNDNSDNNNNGNSNNNNGNSNNNNGNENDNNSNSNNNNGNENDNNSNSNNNNGNDNNGNDNNGNDNNGNDNNGNDNNGNDNGDEVVTAPAPPTVHEPAPSVCSTPGQEMTFTSEDGRVAVKVFSSLTQSVKFSIRMPIDSTAVPPAPGPVVGGLLFQLIAETCDGSPIATLPAEVNLGVHYADADAAGLTEASFGLSRLDSSANQWRAVAKQATDPGANFTSATIVDLGYYILHQRS
jgi:hypothetical protein